MAEAAAAVVAEMLRIRNLPFAQQIVQGGAAVLMDKEVSLNTKQGYLSHLGNVAKSSFQTKVESTDFDTAMSTGIMITEAKPIKKMNMPFQVTINAPSLRTLGLALYAGDPATWTQAAIVADQNKAFTDIVLDVWYPLGAHQISKFEAAKNVAGVFTELTETGDDPDYALDTELGAVMFLSTGSLVAGDDVNTNLQAPAITAFPKFTPQTSIRYIYAGVYIYMVMAQNEAKAKNEIWLRYAPRARIEPSGNLDYGADKPAEVTLDITPVPSNEIAGEPFGYLRQIQGDKRAA